MIYNHIELKQQISLFVLAAGMGSRYGGLKQMEGFGPNGETLIDYSIYDAIQAGFTKVVFVIRPDMEEVFKEVFLSKYENKIDIQYVFQSVDKLPNWYELNNERTKPWGTGHALLMAKDVIKEPSLVINGDDFYGRESFEISSKFLKEECSKDIYSITTYKLKNVLSNNGSVKRGVCDIENEYLKSVNETFDIERKEDGSITGMSLNSEQVVLHDDDNISMNMFGIYPSAFEHLEKRFDEFLRKNKEDVTGEFLLPEIFNDMVNVGDIRMKVLQSSGKWFGVTYKEDGEIVRASLRELIKNGVYPEKLF